MLRGQREGGAGVVRHDLPAGLLEDVVHPELRVELARLEIDAADDDDRSLVHGAACVAQRKREVGHVVGLLARRADRSRDHVGLRVEGALGGAQIRGDLVGAVDGAHVHDVDLLVDGDGGVAAGPTLWARRQRRGGQAEGGDDVDLVAGDGVEAVDFGRETLALVAPRAVGAEAASEDDECCVDENDGSVGASDGQRRVQRAFVLLRER